MASPSGSSLLLARYYKDMTKGQAAKDLPGVSVGLVNSNVFEWEVMLMINDDCKYYGGQYNVLPAHAWRYCKADEYCQAASSAPVSSSRQTFPTCRPP